MKHLRRRVQQEASDRLLFDALNNMPPGDQADKTDRLTQILIARGMSPGDATATATAAYARWATASKSMGA